jgi:hypothetical protein
MVVATIFSFKQFLYAPLTTGVAMVAIATIPNALHKSAALLAACCLLCKQTR